jgi:hypothetical protein
MKCAKSYRQCVGISQFVKRASCMTWNILLHDEWTGPWKEAGVGQFRHLLLCYSRRPVTAENTVKCQVTPCGICGGQSGAETGHSPSTATLLQHHVVTCLPPAVLTLGPLLGSAPESTNSVAPL